MEALYAWNAGRFTGILRGIEAGNFAVANMTGANCIRIGIGWAGITLFTILRPGETSDLAVKERSRFLADAVTLDPDISLEVVFLLVATLWAFLTPLNGGIDIFGMMVLVGIFHRIGLPAPRIAVDFSRSLK